MSKHDKKAASKKNPDNFRKGNYKIFAVNFYDASLRTIQHEFLKQIKNGIRKNVLGFSLDDIKKELVRKEEFPGSQRISLNGGGFNKVLLATIDRITKYKTQYDAMLEAIKNREKFDLLKYWEEHPIQPEGNQQKGKNPGKAKKTDTPKKSDSTSTKGKNGGKAKGRAGSVAGQQISCQLTELPQINLSELGYSNIRKRDQTDSEISTNRTFVEDSPTGCCELYIVLVGNFGSKFYLELIRKGLPLLAVIAFEKDMKTRDVKLATENENSFKMNDTTKPIGIFAEKLQPISECMATKYALDIFKELCWYLYDTEMLYCEKYMSFLNDFYEIDLIEKAQCAAIETSEEPHKYACDNLQVNAFLDTLLDRVDSNHEQISDSDEFYEQRNKNEIDWFISNSFSRTIFEDANVILKCHVNGEINMQELYKESERIKEKFLSQYPEPEKKSFPLKDDSHYELLSEYAFYQRFLYLRDTFDHVEVATDDNYTMMKFQRHINSIYEETSKSYLLTKVCFRDFCEYIYPKISDVIKPRAASSFQGSGNSYSVAESSRDPSADTFLRIPSLKYLKIEKESPRHSMIDTPVPKSAKSLKERKPAKSENAKLNASPTEKTFTGYNLGDKYVELTATETIYRSDFGHVKTVKDSWLYGKAALAIELNISGYNLVYHRELPVIDKLHPQLRLSTSNGITIMTDFTKSLTIDQDEVHSPHVHISWPNGLMITNVDDNVNGFYTDFTAISIHQELAAKSTDETRRIFTSDGSVLIYYDNGTVSILRYNGTVYRTTTNILPMDDCGASKSESGSLRNVASHGDDNGAGGDYTTMLTADQKFATEMDFMTQLESRSDFDCKNFHVTTTEGFTYEISNKQIVHANHKFLVSEKMDYSVGKIFTVREDGVQFTISKDSFQCQHADGTLITTVIDERNVYLSDDEIDEEDAESRNSTDGKLAFPGFVGDVTTPIVKELMKIATGEIFISYNTSFFIEHENYASVHFTEDNTTIYSPSEIKISLSKDDLQISIGSEISFNCNETECTFDAKECNCSATIPLRISSDTCNLLNMSYQNDTLSLSREGQLTLEAHEDPEGIVSPPQKTSRNSFESKPNISLLSNLKSSRNSSSGSNFSSRDISYLNQEKCSVDGNSEESSLTDRNLTEERVLLLPLESENGYGFEILSNSKMTELLKNEYDQKFTKSNKDSGFTIAMSPFDLIEDLFVMRLPPDVDFIISRDRKFKCDDDIKHFPRALSIRSFYKPQHSPENVANMSQEDIWLEMSELVNRCLSCLLENHCPSQTATVNPGRINQFKNDSMNKKQRKIIYNAMLAKETYPTYSEFHERGDDVKEIDVCKVFTEKCQ